MSSNARTATTGGSVGGRRGDKEIGRLGDTHLREITDHRALVESAVGTVPCEIIAMRVVLPALLRCLTAKPHADIAGAVPLERVFVTLTGKEPLPILLKLAHKKGEG